MFRADAVHLGCFGLVGHIQGAMEIQEFSPVEGPPDTAIWEMIFLTRISCRWDQFLSEPLYLTALLILNGATAGIIPVLSARGSAVLGLADKCCPAFVQAGPWLGSTTATVDATGAVAVMMWFAKQV